MADTEQGGAVGETGPVATGEVATDASPVAAVASEPVPKLPEFAVPKNLVVLSSIIGRLIVVAVGLCILIYLIFRVGPVSLALFLALFTTALAGPVAGFFQRFLPKVVSVVLALLVIVVAAVVILFLVIRSIASQGPALVNAVTSGIQDIETWMRTGPLQMSETDLASVIKEAQTWATGLGKSMLIDVASGVGAIGTVMVAGSIYLFATLFFMVNGRAIWNWVVGWVPVRARHEFDVSGDLAWESMAGYTRGVVVVAICDAVLVFIGLEILRVPMAAGLAAIVFMGAFIPVIGAPIATLVSAVVALAANGLLTAILVIALTVVVGSFDGDVMQPLVMGKAVSLHPLAIVVIIGVGAITMGIIGALIAVPVASSIYSVVKYLSGRGVPTKMEAKLSKNFGIPGPN
ncbi:MAG: AI-2E family transporter [Actinomycetes bacterium]